jgi:molecular chaperone GrpE
MNEEQPAGATESAAEAVDTGIEALRREAEEQRERYLRSVAEIDNLRKRSAREIDAARKFGAEKLAQAILPVRDSIEAGLAAAEKSGYAALLDGQRATLRLFDDALAAVGIREIAPRGELFDPNKHEALTLVTVPNVAANTVIEVVQKGYEMNERLLRAAKVIVARDPGA